LNADLTLMIGDRTVPGLAWTLRRSMAEHAGTGFGKWLASSQSGRFIVIVFDSIATDMRDPTCRYREFLNLENEDELLSYIRECVSDLRMRARDTGVEAVNCALNCDDVAPEVKARIERLLSDFDAQGAGSASSAPLQLRPKILAPKPADLD
jgi:hypothetical protein